MSDLLIRVEGVSFSYRPEDSTAPLALKDINLTIARGEYVAIIGHNGSGKSTLARHLNALLVPTRGDVWVGPWNTRDARCRRDIRRTVGMVFQVPDNQIVATTVEDDVAFGPENLGVPEEELGERVRQALETVGLWEERRRPPHQLSAGQKQRLAIAGVIAMRPECLVLDEGTSLLDPQGRADLLATLRQLHAAGTTIVAITHHMPEAAEAQRVLIMSEGRIALEGTPRQVFAQADTLRSLGLDMPPVAALANALHRRRADFPPDLLAVPELADAVAARWVEEAA
ncbi:MAG: energy-coupling factor transporter ATPase [Anaerolineae bacterium]|nr:energy-coupling factor transporter ATPase [Anaerolineae bacterium]